VWDITEWVLNETVQPISANNVFIEGDVQERDFHSSEEAALYSELTKVINVIKKTITIGKIRKIVKEKFRTYEEMLNGKLCYSETVMYKLEKYLSDKQGTPIGQPIQSFYFPNVNSIDKLQFVDTQVKYGVSYCYKILAYQFVVGTK
jgi:hypothetical protein